MAVLFAYIFVVLIWATTPLAIQWSSDSVTFVAAVALRMGLALALALVISTALRRSLFAYVDAWKVYLAASIGIFPNMPLVYWSAQFIPSGLIAVIFAMSPFVTGVMSLLILRESPFNRRRLFALLIAFAGLVIIFHQQIRLDAYAAYGIAGIFGSTFLFSVSSVWLKSLNTSVAAFDQATGALLFAMPGLLLAWYVFDGALPTTVSDKSAGAIVYLAVMGSLVGFTLFFYVLKKLSPSAVSLITLLTPVLALFIGVVVAGERLTLSTLIGSGLVMLALLFYIKWSFGHWFEKSLRRTAVAQAALADIKTDYIRYK